MRSRFISKPLAFDAEQRAIGARYIVDAQLDPVGVAEVEFGQITMKVALGTMLVHADHAALEDRVVAFDGVGVDFHASFAVSVAPLAARMVNSVMLRKLVAKLGIACRLIGHDVAFAVKVFADNRHNLAFRGALNMERAGRDRGVQPR